MKTDPQFKSLALVKDASEAPAEGPKTFLFKGSDGLPDRSGDRVAVAGWNLDNYRANPVVLLNHDDGAPGMFESPRPVLPVAKANVYVTGDALYAEITFDQGDPLALDAQRKVENGFLNAVSVRFQPMPGKAAPNELNGFDYTGQELLEISLVDIPCNPRAVRVKSYQDQVNDIATKVVELIEQKKTLLDPQPEIMTVTVAVPETAPEPQADPQKDLALETVTETPPDIDSETVAALVAEAILNQLYNTGN